MNFNKVYWLGFAIGPLLLWQSVHASDPALFKRPSLHGADSSTQTRGSTGKHPPKARRPRAGKNRQTSTRGTRNGDRSGGLAELSSNAAENRDRAHAAAQMQRSRREFQQRDRQIRAAEKYAAREQAERDARAERIYRSSQLSAPIIVEATACKRIGSHGESVYENCQLTAACNADGGVATCRPAE